MTRWIWLFAATLSGAAQTTLTLRSALDAAGRMSPTVQSAQLSILESEAAAMRVKAGYGPQLSLVIGGAYQTTNLQGIGVIFPGFPSRVGPYRTFNARPVLTQTVLDLSLLDEIRASRERISQVKDEAEVTREATLFAVLQLYLQALEADSRVSAAQARLRTAEGVLAQTMDREQAGAASRLDVERARQEQENERVVVTAAKRDRDVLQSLLVRTIGMEGEVTLDPVAETKRVDRAVDRAEVRAFEARLRVETLETRSAERQRWPKLGVAGDYGVVGAGPEQSLSTYAVGATLTVPLWTSRRIESEIAAARLRRQRTEQALRDARLQIAQEMKQARIEEDASLEALAAARRSAAAAKETLELARLRFTAGMGTNLDTVVAQGVVAQAEDQEIRLRYQNQLARARMARATGDVYGFLGGD